MKTEENITHFYGEPLEHSLKKSKEHDKFGNKTHKKFGNGYFKRDVLGKAVGDCKKHKPCLVTIINEINKEIVKLMLIDKDVREGEIIYTDNSDNLYELNREFLDAIEKYNLTPKNLTDFLVQKNIVEKIINS